VKEQLREAHMRTKLGRGDASPDTLIPSDSATTFSLTSSPDPNKTRSLAPLPWLSMRGDFQDHLMTPWLWAQSKIPSQLSVRPSGRTVGPIQPRTMTSNLASFYTNSFKPTRTLTQRKATKSHPRLRHCRDCKTESGVATRNIATHHPCLFLCHAFL
jgi:hypothetical protein